MAPVVIGANVDSNDQWSSPTPGPKRSVSSVAATATLTMTPKSHKATAVKYQDDHDHYDSMTSFTDEVPRMELFETKAEIQYLPEEDHLAALAYSDRNCIKKKKSKRKEGVSGYNFHKLLKKQR